jgi:hypothetical protein
MPGRPAAGGPESRVSRTRDDVRRVPAAALHRTPHHDLAAAHPDRVRSARASARLAGDAAWAAIAAWRQGMDAAVKAAAAQP